MPNHVANLISGPSIAAIKAVLCGPKDAVDFNSLIPRPEIIRHTASGFRDFDGKRLESWFIENPDEPDYKKKVERPFTADEERQLREIGFRNWYDWSVAKWGTKWNAYDVIDRGDALYFETAWAFPQPVFDALIAALPDAEFTWSYADEDYGRNLGAWKREGGASWYSEPKGDDDYRQLWAMRLHGHDDEYIAQYRADIAADAAADDEYWPAV